MDDDSVTPGLSGADIGVVVAYFVLVVLVGVLAMWRANKGTVTGYFLAGRSMWFLPVGASLFVSNIGTEHFIGLAGSGAAQGISVGAWEFNALILLQVLGWIFVPVYIASGVCTMPEYLSKRFGGTRLRTYFAVLSLVLYVFTKCSGDLYTGALFIQQSMQWDLYVSIFTLILITAALTLTGGLTAVIYTDTLQAFLMVGGALYLMAVGFSEVGGLEGLVEKYPQAVPTVPEAIVPNTTCHYPDKKAFKMLRAIDDDYTPWLGFLLGQTPGSIWYWCTDQVIVQRALAAKSISHAQGATLMAGFIKVLPLFMMVMPGMISRVLYPNEVACTNPDYCMKVCQSKAGCSNIAYPRLVLGLMPEGARGLMMAVMVAALMSDLDSIFNSASTLFTMDVWGRLRGRRASNTELMVVGRLFVCAMVGASIAWIPVIKETQRGQVFIYIQEVTNYLAPPFAAVFLLGVLCPFVNEKGVFWGLMLALVTGIVRLFSVLILKGEEYCGSTDQYPEPAVLSNFHYMYFAFFITALTGVTAVLISLLTRRPSEKMLCRTTYWTRKSKDVSQSSELKNMENAQCHGQLISSGESRGPEEQVVAKSSVKTDVSDHRSDPVTQIKQAKEPSLKNRAFRFLIGISDDGSQEDSSQALQAAEIAKQLKQLADLHQSRKERILLNFLLGLILAMGLSMFLFWSLHDFQPGPFFPDGASPELLAHLRGQNSSEP